MKKRIAKKVYGMTQARAQSAHLAGLDVFSHRRGTYDRAYTICIRRYRRARQKP